MGNLFASGELRLVFEVRTREMVTEIESYSANRLQSASTEDLTKYFYEKYMFEQLVLNRKAAELDDPPEEVQADARLFPDVFVSRAGATLPAVRYTLRVPFEGSSDLFYYQPTRYTPAGTPSGEVDSSHLVLRTTRRHTDPSTAVEAGFNRELDDVMNQVDWANRDLEAWLSTLRRTAWERIEARKQRLQAAQATAKGMTFKLKERTDAPKTFPAPEVRRKIQPKVVSPPGSPAPYKSEPTLVDEEYEHILSVISRISIVMERSPHAFITMDEESLRTHLLVQLNGHYEGQATGETFNFEGKTDILIRVEGKNIFIAECKIWSGQKALFETIDQLLGYTQWRDTKTAIIIFNRNKDFSAVVQQIKPTMESHSKFKRFEKQISETAFRFAFKQRDDDGRELTLTVMAFNVPSTPATPATPSGG